MLKTPIQCILAVLIVLSMPAVASAEATPEQMNNASGFVQTLANDTIAILEDKAITRAEQEDRFRTMMEASFEVDFIAQLALGRHYRTANESERAAYLGLFDDFMLNTILSNLSGFNGEMLAVTGTKPAGKVRAISWSRQRSRMAQSPICLTGESAISVTRRWSSM